LLGHLTYFGAFFAQGELLCTQGLAYLLKDERASARLVEWLGEIAPDWRPPPLIWHAEAVQHDGARPDLEGRAEGRARVKIEAKLGAPLTTEQVRSYAEGLSAEDGLLVVLVPGARAAEIIKIARSALKSGEPSHGTASSWRSAAGLRVAVVAWKDLFGALRQAAIWPSGGELDQLEGLYVGLTSQHIEPLADLPDLEAWEPRANDLFGLVDRVTRKLQAELRPEWTKALPFGTDSVAGEPEAATHRGYRRRYVCARICYSVGVRHSFQGRSSPLWLRVHGTTAGFEQIRYRLRASTLAPRLVESEGHTWIELELPLGVSGDVMVEALARPCRNAWALIAPPAP
jgi:hypothetical protein